MVPCPQAFLADKVTIDRLKQRQKNYHSKQTKKPTNKPKKPVWYWHRDQWNRIKSLEISPCIYGQFIFDKEAKNNQWGGE